MGVRIKKQLLILLRKPANGSSHFSCKMVLLRGLKTGCPWWLIGGAGFDKSMENGLISINDRHGELVRKIGKKCQ
jgi:hypothetical protein